MPKLKEKKQKELSFALLFMEFLISTNFVVNTTQGILKGTQVLVGVAVTDLSSFLNAGLYRPFTVDDIPRPSCDHKEQTEVLYKNPDTKVRGPLPIRLFPAFKSGEHIFGSQYNLADKSQSMFPLLMPLSHCGTVYCK